MGSGRAQADRRASGWARRASASLSARCASADPVERASSARLPGALADHWRVASPMLRADALIKRRPLGFEDPLELHLLPLVVVPLAAAWARPQTISRTTAATISQPALVSQPDFDGELAWYQQPHEQSRVDRGAAALVGVRAKPAPPRRPANTPRATATSC